MERKPIVSVIVPCYNQAHFLQESIGSVLMQSIDNWECIIVNDGSNDNTEDVASQLVGQDSRISYLYKPNGGLSSARNVGIKAAIGKYILPLDCDDKIAHSYLERAVSFLEKNPEYTMYYAKAEFFGAKSGVWDISWKGYKDLLQHNSIYCSSVFRREDCLYIGGYDESFRSGLEDWDFNIRLLYGGKKVYQANEIMFYYRKSDKGDSMSDLFNENYNNIARMVYAKHIEKYIPYWGDPLEVVWGIHWSQRRIPQFIHRLQQKYQKIYNFLKNN